MGTACNPTVKYIYEELGNNVELLKYLVLQNWHMGAKQKHLHSAPYATVNTTSIWKVELLLTVTFVEFLSFEVLHFHVQSPLSRMSQLIVV